MRPVHAASIEVSALRYFPESGPLAKVLLVRTERKKQKAVHLSVQCTSGKGEA